MAALQEREGSYRVLFRYHGKQHTCTIGKVSPEEAEAKAAQVDYLLLRLRQRVVAVPPGTDIVTSLRYDGNPPEAYRVPESAARATLGTLRDRHLSTDGNGTVEENSPGTARLHFAHFCRELGEAFPLPELSAGRLQEYVDNRARKKVRGRRLSPVTLRKEVATLRAAWNWGGPMGLTGGPFPGKGLRYPKAEEKPPFMTRAEIEAEVARGADDPDEPWECLYLTLPEIAELLDFARGAARQPWVYPMLCFAAHTGARRSEMLRALVADVDFRSDTVLVRERKKAKDRRTTRRVPLTPPLKEVLEGWLARHPGASTSSASARRSAGARSGAGARGTRGRRRGPRATGAGWPRSGPASGRGRGPSPRTRPTTTSSGRSPAPSGRCSAAGTFCGTASSRPAPARGSTSGSSTSGSATRPRRCGGATGTATLPPSGRPSSPSSGRCVYTGEACVAGATIFLAKHPGRGSRGH
jgi:integrase